MTLQEIVRRIGEFDRESTIYASRPWKPSSVAVVAPESRDGSAPAEAIGNRCEYFLEIFVAADFLEDWRLSLGRDPSAIEASDRLIQYAENDA